MAASAHYLAAQVAFEALQAGGNAIDAGVAGGIALGVVQCEFVHFGGVAPIMVRIAETGETWTVSGLGPWPQLADADYFRGEHGGAIPPGIRRAVVPGAPDAWITALERWGTMSFGEAAAMATAFARNGFEVSAFTRANMTALQPGFARYPQNAAVFLRDGFAPEVGERLVQRQLADTLDYLAAEERAAARAGGRQAGLQAARAAFYEGDIAAAIDTYHRDNGGWLRRSDLATFRVEVERPVQVRFGDIDLHACGPWSQGPVLAQALRLLDGVDLRVLEHNRAAYIHRLAETLKLAFADRHAYYGDPKFVDVPMAALLSDAVVAARRSLIDPARAAPGMPAPSNLGASAPRELPVGGAPKGVEPDTSHLCVIDQAGNLFSSTPSDGCSGGPMIPGTGIVPSTRGVQSWTDAAHPACLAPGKRPWLTPSPAIAVQGDRVMPFGTPGGDVQPQAMLQVLLNAFVWQMPVQAAIDAPRFASESFPNASEPHAYHPGRLDLEASLPRRTGEELAALGHQVQWWEERDARAGGVSAIIQDRATGRLQGGADDRRPGGVVGS